MKINSPRSYSLIVGSALFLLGLFGFAFRGSFKLGSGYLLFALVLGFWGVVVAVGSKQ